MPDLIRFTDLATADTPLSGDEILALVQGGISKQVSITDILAGATGPTLEAGAGIDLDTSTPGTVIIISTEPDAQTLATVIAALAALTFVTIDDESTPLPNSRQLLPGTNMAFDTATPGQLTLNASGGGSAVKMAYATINGDGSIEPGSLNVDGVVLGAFGVYAIDVTSAGFVGMPVGSATWNQLLAGAASGPIIDCTAVSIAGFEVQSTQGDASTFEQAFNFIAFGQ